MEAESSEERNKGGSETLKNSEQIKAFLDFVEDCSSLNAMAREGISTEEKRQQDLLHMIEFETSSKKRGPIDTKLHRCRTSRRRYKDIFEETDDIVQFFREPQHKKTLEQLRQLLGKVRKVERYHQNRSYTLRVKEE